MCTLPPSTTIDRRETIIAHTYYLERLGSQLLRLRCQLSASSMQVTFAALLVAGTVQVALLHSLAEPVGGVRGQAAAVPASQWPGTETRLLPRKRHLSAATICVPSTAFIGIDICSLQASCPTHVPAFPQIPTPRRSPPELFYWPNLLTSSRGIFYRTGKPRIPGDWPGPHIV